MEKFFKFGISAGAFALLFSTLALSGCAIGPLMSHETARTVGEANHELTAAYGHAGYDFNWNYGLTDNLDFGLHLESFSVGLRAKYAFMKNNSRGWSFAGAAGIGSSVGGSHYYADIISSYLVNSWEPYGTLRFVHVSMDPVEFKNKDTGNVDFKTNRYDYDYGQVFLGTRYWFTEHWLVSLEVASLFQISQDVQIGNNVIGAIAFGYRF